MGFNSVFKGLNKLHSCNRQGVVAARLISEWPGSITPLQKMIYLPESKYVESITVELLSRMK
jgi:hypothetical protein